MGRMVREKVEVGIRQSKHSYNCSQVQYLCRSVQDSA
jgi:hypothetical protein